MAYQAAPQEFAARTSTSVRIMSSAPAMLAHRAFAFVAKIFKGIGQSYVKAALASSRLDLVQKLNAKSDAELEQLGIKREDIVHFVFRDLYHI